MSYGNYTHDGVMQEHPFGSRVAAVHPDMPPIRSYVEAAADYYVVKPSSSFILASPNDFVKWNTTWGASPSSCPLRSTMGSLASLYGFEDNTTWSPSCWDLKCPGPMSAYGNVSEPFQPSRTAFRPYAQPANLSNVHGNRRCTSDCADKCELSQNYNECATQCLDSCGDNVSFSSWGGVTSADACNDDCAERCSHSSNVNECFLPCNSRCPKY